MRFGVVKFSTTVLSQILRRVGQWKNYEKEPSSIKLFYPQFFSYFRRFICDF